MLLNEIDISQNKTTAWISSYFERTKKIPTRLLTQTIDPPKIVFVHKPLYYERNSLAGNYQRLVVLRIDRTRLRIIPITYRGKKRKEVFWRFATAEALYFFCAAAGFRPSNLSLPFPPVSHMSFAGVFCLRVASTPTGFLPPTYLCYPRQGRTAGTLHPAKTRDGVVEFLVLCDEWNDTFHS